MTRSLCAVATILESSGMRRAESSTTRSSGCSAAQAAAVGEHGVVGQHGIMLTMMVLACQRKGCTAAS